MSALWAIPFFIPFHTCFYTSWIILVPIDVCESKLGMSRGLRPAAGSGPVGNQSCRSKGCQGPGIWLRSVFCMLCIRFPYIVYTSAAALFHTRVKTPTANLSVSLFLFPYIYVRPLQLLVSRFLLLTAIFILKRLTMPMLSFLTPDPGKFRALTGPQRNS